MLAIWEVVTRRWRVAAGLALCLAWLPVASAFADHRAPFDGTMHSYGEMVDYPLVFPVLGDYRLSDTFYAARSGGDHHAQDIMADKMTPIVAAASGTIRWINWSRNPNDLNPDRCCTMVITHDDGWETWYIHMNNDTPGTDDGLGWGIAPGLLPGMRVEAGELIGWVGDSGNAEWTLPHLHFELYDPEGVIVNPYEALLNATQTSCAGGCTPFIPLSDGSSGAGVLHLQVMLSRLGYDPGPASGYYGFSTEGAVGAFQSDNGLSATGTVDRVTWNAIYDAYLLVQTPARRLAGADRYETAAVIAEETHPDSAAIVFVAVGTNYPDAVAAGPSAHVVGAPILLVRPDSVPAVTQAALQRLSPDTVMILGGTAAINASVESEIVALLPGADVSRLAGATRYETAVDISRFGFAAGAPVVYVATGENFPDSLVAAPAAAAEDGSLLLVRSDSVPPAVAAELTRLAPSRIVVVGGTVSVSPAVFSSLSQYAASVERISGPNRFAVAAAVAASVFPDGANEVFVAVGDKFPDALAGGALAAGRAAPLVLVQHDEIPLDIANEVRRLTPSQVTVLGGPAAVSEVVGAVLAGIHASTAPDDGGGFVYDPDGGVEQWRPLVQQVFGRWGLDQEKCGTGARAGDCIGPQVDNALVIMACESGGDPAAVNSSSGTTGLFQHRPSYWPARVARVQTHFPDFPSDASAFDPEHNVMVAALLVHESRDALIGENSLTGPWDDGPEPWGHWDSSARYCADPPLVNP